jgi:hypothetical protein
VINVSYRAFTVRCEPKAILLCIVTLSVCTTSLTCCYCTLQGAVPPSIEVKLLDFMSCLTAQQLFVLKVLSVIGAYDIPVALLEHVYPIPVVHGSSLAADVLALESCKIIWVTTASAAAALAATATAATAAAAATDATAAAASTGSSAGKRASSKQSVIMKGMIVSFRDLVLHQVVYQKLSHNHRRELHTKLSDFYIAQQHAAALNMARADAAAEEALSASGGPTAAAAAAAADTTTSSTTAAEAAAAATDAAAGTAGATTGGAAVLPGLVIPPQDIVPCLIHHLTLAQKEQKVTRLLPLLAQ